MLPCIILNASQQLNCRRLPIQSDGDCLLRLPKSRFLGGVRRGVCGGPSIEHLWRLGQSESDCELEGRRLLRSKVLRFYFFIFQLVHDAEIVRRKMKMPWQQLGATTAAIPLGIRKGSVAKKTRLSTQTSRLLAVHHSAR
jgi:hypothetical protein